MAVDWDKPDNSTLIEDLIAKLRERDERILTMSSDDSDDSNIPDGALRINSSTGIFERWNASGSTWEAFKNSLPASPSDGDLAQYDSSSGLWVAKSLDEVIGGWSTWTPTGFSASGSMTWTSVSHALEYVPIGPICFIRGSATGETGGTNSNHLIINGLPVSPVGESPGGGVDNAIPVVVRRGGSTDEIAGAFVRVNSGSPDLTIKMTDLSNFGIGSGRRVSFFGGYSIA